MGYADFMPSPSSILAYFNRSHRFPNDKRNPETPTRRIRAPKVLPEITIQVQGNPTLVQTTSGLWTYTYEQTVATLFRSNASTNRWYGSYAFLKESPTSTYVRKSPTPCVFSEPSSPPA
ncbi:hypothetical protein HPB50_022525 [Hyalomma asiaticum]|uniref:Uncharacterized protein n=1 Tax=Hyalomma asiaticum TaxID=266040 RepID=A0ACB7S2U7_HYAAI|nr:hypothetical protein HPB50_022525 [Hyalomma asiaticum]